MVSATVLPRMTIAEYLEREAAADQRHELIDGEIYAMAGGSPRHAAIAATLIGALYAQLRGTECRPTTGDQRIFVPATGSMFYADVAVICGVYQLASADPNAVTNPTLIIEVLSPGRLSRSEPSSAVPPSGGAFKAPTAGVPEGTSRMGNAGIAVGGGAARSAARPRQAPDTADHDRGTKFEHYRQLPSLQEYLLVSQSTIHVDHRRRLEGDTWLMQPVTEGSIELRSLGVSIALDEIYAGLDALPAV